MYFYFSTVFSCAANCEVCEWNSQTCDVTRSFQLSQYNNMKRIAYHQQKLYCCKLTVCLHMRALNL